MKVPKVSVLMPTFNGERYLTQQLESVLSQKNVEVALLIQDDGSSDKTLDILNQYRENISLFNSVKNQGTSKTLIELIKRVDDADYLAFCDQDDIWKSNHLISAINVLKNANDFIPAMTFPIYEYIDGDSNLIGIRKRRKKVSLGNSLVENPAIGCGIVLNKAGIKLIQDIEFDQELFIDQQIYFCFSALGSVFQGADRTVQYRLHDKNQVGVRSLSNSILRLKQALKYDNLKNTRHSLTRLAEINSKQFPELLSSFTRKHFYGLDGHFINRIKYALRPNFERESWLDQVIFQVMIIAGKY